ncbi:MAG: hypothetical protein FWG10_12345 [Eubacteriaceae bacterium]|nr:hypothetical protein [Eubacteriaceae bacterium]
MKKLLAILALIAIWSSLHGCASRSTDNANGNGANSKVDIFQLDSDGFIESINDALARSDLALSYDIDSKHTSTSFNNSHIASYESADSRLDCLVNKEDKLVSIRLVLNDGKHVDEIVEAVNILLHSILSVVDEGSIKSLLDDFEKYRDLRISQSSKFDNILFTYTWDESGNFEYTITPGAEPPKGWSKAEKLNAMDYRIPADWEEYYVYPDLGIAYITPSGLTVTVTSNEINLNMISLILEITLDQNDPESVFIYLKADMIQNIETLVTDDMLVPEYEMLETVVAGASAIEAAYSLRTVDGELVKSNQQVFFIFDKRQYSIFVSSDKILGPSDLKLFSEFKDTMSLK